MGLTAQRARPEAGGDARTHDTDAAPEPGLAGARWTGPMPTGILRRESTLRPERSPPNAPPPTGHPHALQDRSP